MYLDLYPILHMVKRRSLIKKDENNRSQGYKKKEENIYTHNNKIIK